MCETLPAPDKTRVLADGRIACEYSGLIEVFDDLRAYSEAHGHAAVDLGAHGGVWRDHKVEQNKGGACELSDDRIGGEPYQDPTLRSVG